MLEECVDHLEMATKSLDKKIVMLEEEENAMLFSNTDSNSTEAEFSTIGPLRNQLSTHSTTN